MKFSFPALGLLWCSAMLTGCVHPASAPATQDVLDPTATKPRLVAPKFIEVPKATAEPGIASAIKKVTVYSDRARVTRAAAVDVTTEPSVFAFKGLPGWVDDGSVRVSASSGRIVDVRVQRDFLVKPSDEKFVSAQRTHQRLMDEKTALEDELKILDAQKAQIESIKAFSIEKISKDTTIGAVSVESYGKVLEFISESLRKTAAQKRAVERARTALSPRIQASQRGLTEMSGMTQLEETTIFLTMQAQAPTSSQVELTYMLPGATWEPVHEVRYNPARPDEVEITSFAVITQTSGEDWTNAAVDFSTQSSSQAVRIPDLEALTLGDTKTATRVLKRKTSSFSRSQRAFKGQNFMWNTLNRTSSQDNFEEVYQNNLDYLQVTQSKTVQMFKTLQKRGTSVHFSAEGLATVRGDGNSVRLRIGRSDLKTRQQLMAAPEQSLNTVRTLETVNTSEQPLLPGKAALYQDGAFLGMTDIDFIAEGEAFALFLSVEDQIKLSRALDKKQSSIVRSKRTRMKLSFIVTVENLSKRRTELNLVDRVPVSQNKDIRVDNIKVTPAVKPDSKGLLKWALTLEPGQKRSFQISYQVEYPPTLILETERRQKNRSKDSYDFEDQIIDLEKNF